jgi:hypothetical protein
MPVYVSIVIFAPRHPTIKDVVQRESLSINTQTETTVASFSLTAPKKMRLRGMG